MVRYSDADIGRAFEEKYFPRVEAVTDVLRLAPLNQNGIYRITNSSNDFMIVCNVRQQRVGIGLVGVVDDEIVVCRELILARNPKVKANEPLLPRFAGIPLEVQDHPFFFVAYDHPTLDYIREHAQLERRLPKAEIRRTQKGVPFYLAEEKNINGVFPVIVRLQ